MVGQSSGPFSRVRTRFFWAAAGVAAAVAACYLAAFAEIFRHGGMTVDFGWSAVARLDGLYVASVASGHAADGRLQPGDRIVAIRGGAVVGPQWYRRTAAPGGAYLVEIERGAERQRVGLVAEPAATFGSWELSLFCAVVALWAVVGLFIGFARPDLRTAQLACLCCVLVSLGQLRRLLYPLSAAFSGVALIAYGALFLVSPLSLTLGYHGLSLFPPGVHVTRGWVRITAGLYGLTVASLIVNSIPSALLYWMSPESAAAFLAERASFFAIGGPLQDVTLLLAALSGPAVLLRNVRHVHEPDLRRRVRWALYGYAFSIPPLLIYLAVLFVLYALHREELWNEPPYRWVMPATAVWGLAAPLTLLYIVVRHRVFEVTVVIRRGLQYLLAKNALRGILILPVVALALTIAANPNRTVKDLLFGSPGYLAIIAAAWVSLVFRRQMLDWLDRKFFREAYDRERILLALLSDMDRLDSVSEIGRLVTSQVEFALHPKAVYVWYRDKEGENLTLAYQSGMPVRRVDLPSESELVRLVGGHSQALKLHSPDLDRLGHEDRRWLEEQAVTMIVPVTDSDARIAGLLMLGEKKSEEDYTPRDRDLLEAIAKQMAVVGDHLRLKERVDEERQIRSAMIARFSGEQINVLKECPRCGTCYDGTVVSCQLDGQELVVSLPVERLVDGKYRLDRLIGRGGMGAVYEAQDLRLERTVAVKILLGRGVSDATALRRFEREARAVAKLTHPNIVTLFDYGRIAAGGAYLVMERLTGVTLRAELKRHGALAPGLIADWFDQVLDGVKTAHLNGVVHRDLKPENILISRQDDKHDRVTILDFGLAKARHVIESDSRTLTVEGMVIGTLGYMSPEQLAGLDVDERSDLFSLGVIAAEALTGRRPFSGTTYTEVLRSILHDTFELPGEAPEIKRLNKTLQRCLAMERTSRFASAAALQEELIPAIRGCVSIFVGAQAAEGQAVTSELTQATPVFPVRTVRQ